MDKKSENKPVRINLGRLDGNAKMPVIRPGDKVTVRVVDRYAPAHGAQHSLAVPRGGEASADKLNKAKCDRT